jgi:hypothetical protein
MPRPSIAGMFDSQIRIRRPHTTTSGPAIEQRTYTVVGTVDAAINRSRSPQAPASGGLARSGIIRWYGLASIDVRERDVCEVIAGPDAGAIWEVNERPVRPRNHHTQVDCVEFNGTLPALEPEPNLSDA